MPQYALIGSHPPNVCPGTSKAAREAAVKAYGTLEKLEKEKHVKLLSDLHLDPNHKAFMLLEAPSAEAVRDAIAEAGFPAFLELDFHLVTPIKQLLERAKELPTIYP